MIDFVLGELSEKMPLSAVVNVGGVGIRLIVSSQTSSKLAEVGTEVKLLAHLLVREDSLLLYGFINESERYLFRMLLSVSGVGPKLAISILSGLQPSSLKSLILSSSVNELVKIPGVGKRTAERIVVDLKDKLSLADIPVASEGEKNNVARKDAFDALIALGYSRQVSEKVLRQVLQDNPDADAQTLIRLALRLI